MQTGMLNVNSIKIPPLQWPFADNSLCKRANTPPRKFYVRFLCIFWTLSCVSNFICADYIRIPVNKTEKSVKRFRVSKIYIAIALIFLVFYSTLH